MSVVALDSSEHGEVFLEELVGEYLFLGLAAVFHRDILHRNARRGSKKFNRGEKRWNG